MPGCFSGNRGMAKMNRIKSAAEQSYFPLHHKKLTGKLCVIEKISQNKLKNSTQQKLLINR
jgi:hypothetical protein